MKRLVPTRDNNIVLRVIQEISTNRAYFYNVTKAVRLRPRNTRMEIDPSSAEALARRNFPLTASSGDLFRQTCSIYQVRGTPRKPGVFFVVIKYP